MHIAGSAPAPVTPSPTDQLSPSTQPARARTGTCVLDVAPVPGIWVNSLKSGALTSRDRVGAVLESPG
jgi:hypothetical protein